MRRKSSSSVRRKLAGKELESRVKKGRQNAEGRRFSIINVEDVQLWNPKDGEHIIDILPYIAGKNDKDVREGRPTYTFEYLVHNRVGAASVSILCLAEMFNQPCPICEHRLQLREKGAEDEVWKALFPKKRNLYNIICYDRGEEEKGVQVWDVPYFYSEKNILSISKKRGRKGIEGKLTNFSHPDTGKSISFVIEPAQSKNDYPTYTGFSFEERDYKIDDESLESCHTLDEIVHIPTYEEVESMYWGSRDRRDGDEEEDSGRSRRSKRSRPSRRTREEEPEEDDVPNASVEDLMDELEDLEDIDELEEFAETYNLDIDITKKSKPRIIKRILQKMIMDLEEPEEEEEEPEEEEEEERDFSWGDIKKMSKLKLKSLIKDEELDIDPDDAEDLDDLREMVAEELDIPF